MEEVADQHGLVALAHGAEHRAPDPGDQPLDQARVLDVLVVFHVVETDIVRAVRAVLETAQLVFSPSGQNPDAGGGLEIVVAPALGFEAAEVVAQADVFLQLHLDRHGEALGLLVGVGDDQSEFDQIVGDHMERIAEGKEGAFRVLPGSADQGELIFEPGDVRPLFVKVAELGGEVVGQVGGEEEELVAQGPLYPRLLLGRGVALERRNRLRHPAPQLGDLLVVLSFADDRAFTHW